MRRLLPVALLVVAGLTGCSGKGPEVDRAAQPASTADVGDRASPSGDPPSLAPGQEQGLDDYDDDGTPDPLCGTQDFGGGLVLRIPCSIRTAHEPETGTRLVKDSLYRLPGAAIDLTGISGEMIFARSVGTDERVFILIFNSDNLFATGRAELNAPDEMGRAIAVINSKLPDGAVQVRGHTDATGTTAGNQTLSVQRAATVQTYLTSNGIKASGATAVGFGSARPLVEETNPDGSVSTTGRAFNRRVEIVVRLPKN